MVMVAHFVVESDTVPVGKVVMEPPTLADTEALELEEQLEVGVTDEKWLRVDTGEGTT